MVERCLKTQDLSAVKEFCQESWRQILDGTVSVQDFIFAKEVKLGTYSDKGAPPPGAALAGKRVLEDPNDEPQYGERIPYVITRGEPGAKLMDRAVPPEEVVYNSNKRIDAQYYISKVLIPPLERIFNLMGADVRSWYNAMIKGVTADNAEAIISGSPSKVKAAGGKSDEESLVEEDEQAAIDLHYRSNRCILCGTKTDEGVCDICKRNPEESLHALLGRVQEVEQRLKNTHTICVSCTESAMAEPIKCESLECPWFYARKQAERDMENIKGVHELTEEIERLACDESENLKGKGKPRSRLGRKGVRSVSPMDVEIIEIL
ncbi:hypothetical protein M422DRAFT_271959 [Sphaerobolus stellatus SS14]|uniref:DNA-directed DNA polymerase n=1 Tax=Sphaerobolus stellatus (strain SS14) TaxID=990650 RepID=A0A0C9TCP4_SPHS4|nr:hypothetical protein M422DRAFT_271959 [Sphaerobolus stellatus SS14]